MNAPISIIGSLQTLPTPPISGNAGEVKEVLPDRRGNNVKSNITIGYRVIQNCSGAEILVAFGQPASATMWNVIVPDRQQLNISSLESVSVYCASAWVVSIIELNQPNGGL